MTEYNPVTEGYKHSMNARIVAGLFMFIGGLLFIEGLLSYWHAMTIAETANGVSIAYNGNPLWFFGTVISSAVVWSVALMLWNASTALMVGQNVEREA